MSLTIGVVTLRALCQERERVGSSRGEQHPTKKRGSRSFHCDSLLGGGYLLSHFRSTIGVVRLNFSVRNGKRWDPHAMTTLFLPFSPDRASCMRGGCDELKRPSGERSNAQEKLLATQTLVIVPIEHAITACLLSFRTRPAPAAHTHPTGPPRGRPQRGSTASKRAIGAQERFRVISTARLRTLPPVHLPPINVVVCNDPNKEILS